MKFRDPYFLLLLVPLVWLIVRAYVEMSRGRFAGKLSVPWRRGWKVEPNDPAMPPRFWPVLVYGMACAFFVLALARPQSSYHKISRSVEGIDIMIVLDLSASMRIEDFRDKSRLDTAKPIIRDFVLGRPTDKVGFESFSGEAVTMVPPTLDHSLVLQAIRSADIGDLKDGTAIGDALTTAVGRLKNSTAKSRVIILCTDGDSNVGQVDPLTGGELAKGFGIKIYSIAIGREGRVAMPFVQKDVFGKQIKMYQYFDNSINPDLLKQISVLTGGKFYRVQDDPKLLQDVFNDIDRLERYKIETTEQVKYNEKYMTLVWYGLFFFLIGFAMQHWLLRVYP